MISNLLTKFKNLICDLFAPTLLIITLISLPLGPIYFPRIHIIGLSVFFAVYLINSVCQVIKFLVSYKRIVNTIKRYPNQSKNYYDPSDDASPTLTADSSSTSSNSLVDELVDETTSFLPLTIPKRTLMHCFVIPNYKEPLGLLRDTVIRLSKHRYAQTQYTIILAMEASEADSDLKGNMLKEELQHMFREFIVTVHPVNVPGEARGKASNVNYAVRQSYRYLTQERDYSLQDLLVTVSDSDSGIPELYTTKLEEAYHSTHNPNTVIYASPTFFSRNPHNVPAVVRIADIMWSAMVIQNLANLRGMIFPCSNYSLSMELAKKVGWWDPYDEAVGEDLHMFLKCFWNTNTVARGVPVYVPINMCHVEVEGFFANIKARYVQARRHYSAIPDLAYTLKHFFSTSTPTSTTDIMTEWDPANRSWFGRFIDRIMVTYLIIEAQMLPMISGWVMVFAIPLIELAVFLPPESTTNPLAVDPFYKVLYQVIKYTSFALPTSLIIQALSYHTLHMKIEKFLHKPPPGKERTHRNLLDFIWLPVLAVFLMTIPSTVACFMRLFNFNLEYITSEKNFDEESSTHD